MRGERKHSSLTRFGGLGGVLVKIYNSITRQKEEFIPLDGKNVKMYACGITVYDLSHIGHARQAIVYSMIADYLRYRGYNVKYVRNYTDVDDKIIAKANALGKNALDFSKEQIEETEKDMRNLHVTDANVFAKASENIENIINFVQELINKGYAYPAETGDVYYDVRSFREYGKLSNRKVDDMLNGVRKDVEPGKRDPIDFALWKSAKPGEIYWESPWGKGRPGWHIECSAMILNNLGETIDIHGGGKDLIFPHHENEIAQQYCLHHNLLANYWIHNGRVDLHGEKMSKSKGNVIWVKDIIKQYPPAAFRLAILSNHYRQVINYNDEMMIQMTGEYEKIVKLYVSYYRHIELLNEEFNGMSLPIMNEFLNEMAYDFNTANAMVHLYTLMKKMNKDFRTKDIDINVLKDNFATLKAMLYILGIDVEINALTKDEKELVLAWKNARENKEFEQADLLRKQINDLGIRL